MAVDWAYAPDLHLHISPDHPDYPRDAAGLRRFAIELGLLPWDAAQVLDQAEQARVRGELGTAAASFARMQRRTAP